MSEPDDMEKRFAPGPDRSASGASVVSRSPKVGIRPSTAPERFRWLLEGLGDQQLNQNASTRYAFVDGVGEGDYTFQLDEFDSSGRRITGRFLLSLQALDPSAVPESLRSSSAEAMAIGIGAESVQGTGDPGATRRWTLVEASNGFSMRDRETPSLQLRPSNAGVYGVTLRSPSGGSLPIRLLIVPAGTPVSFVADPEAGLEGSQSDAPPGPGGGEARAPSPPITPLSPPQEEIPRSGKPAPDLEKTDTVPVTPVPVPSIHSRQPSSPASAQLEENMEERHMDVVPGVFDYRCRVFDHHGSSSSSTIQVRIDEVEESSVPVQAGVEDGDSVTLGDWDRDTGLQDGIQFHWALIQSNPELPAFEAFTPRITLLLQRSGMFRIQLLVEHDDGERHDEELFLRFLPVPVEAYKLHERAQSYQGSRVSYDTLQQVRQALRRGMLENALQQVLMEATAPIALVQNRIQLEVVENAAEQGQVPNFRLYLSDDPGGSSAGAHLRFPDFREETNSLRAKHGSVPIAPEELFVKYVFDFLQWASRTGAM